MHDGKLNLTQLDALVFDFDGVLTDNRVHLDESGKEWVSCNRADGLAFDVLRKLNFPAYILSTELNPVVSARARKIKIPILQGLTDKSQALLTLVENNGYCMDRVLYIGNDLNDYDVMMRCGVSVCPADSHPIIKEMANFVLETRGGDGVARELLENLLNVDFLKILCGK